MLHNDFFMDDLITHLKFYKLTVMIMIVLLFGCTSIYTVVITTKYVSTIVLRTEGHSI